MNAGIEMRGGHRVGVAAAVVAFLAALTGCPAGYSHTDISNVSQNELAPVITSQTIAIAHGGIATAHVAPFNSDQNPMVGDIVSSDPSVVTVVRAFGDKNYAFFGKKVGAAEIDFKADGITVGRVTAQVREQPTSP